MVVSQLITPDGGLISVGNYQDGYSYLYFPPDALTEYIDKDIATLDGEAASASDLTLDGEKSSGIGIQIYCYWHTESLVQADFYPEGLVFSQPVYIRFSYKNADLTGIDEEKLGIYYYNPFTGSWELVSNQVNTAEDYVEGYLEHFSRYAIGME